MEDASSEKAPWSGALIVVLLAPTLYCLSIGPAAMVYNSASRPVKTFIEFFYKPIELLTTKLPWLREIVESYLSLWL